MQKAEHKRNVNERRALRDANKQRVEAHRECGDEEDERIGQFCIMLQHNEAKQKADYFCKQFCAFRALVFLHVNEFSIFSDFLAGDAILFAISDSLLFECFFIA